jgi:hypothetical protein
VRKALATLPWVEQRSIETNVKTHEVRFNLKDKAAWDEEKVKNALKDQSFPVVRVKSLAK